MKWRVYYDNGSTWDDDVDNAPMMHVLLIQEINGKHGRRIVPPGDYYIYRFDREKWLSMDFVGMIQYLAEPGTQKKVLMGKMVLPDEWGAILRTAKEDLDFPPRSGYYPAEPKE